MDFFIFVNILMPGIKTMTRSNSNSTNYRI